MSLFRSYLNDRALVGFSSQEQLREALMSVVQARSSTPNLRRALYCSRATSMLLGASGETLVAAAQGFPREQRAAILQWLGRFGPFLEDEREPSEDDLYYFGIIDVTDEGLGEAARQYQRGHDARVVSLPTGNGFDIWQTTLTLAQGLLDEPIVTLAIPNHHSLDELAEIANDSAPEPANWTELTAYCRGRFVSLRCGPPCRSEAGA